MSKKIKITESQLKKIIENRGTENYMFFSNLQQIHRQCEILMKMNSQELDQIIQNGHDWADDHVSEAKNNMDQVFDFFMNETKSKDDMSQDLGGEETQSDYEMPGYQETMDNLNNLSIRQDDDMVNESKKKIYKQISRIKSLNEQLLPNNKTTGVPLGIPGFQNTINSNQEKPNLSCVDTKLFTQKDANGKMYHVIDKPSSIPGGVRERIVLYNDGTGYITQTGNKGKWKCGTSGVEFRTDADPNAVKYLGKITSSPSANNQNPIINCASSLNEIKQGSNKILKQGCKTDAVKKLQEMLGMPTNQQTGFFGDVTKSKVIEFQKVNKDAEGNPLVVDGKVGDKTYNSMVTSKSPVQTEKEPVKAPQTYTA